MVKGYHNTTVDEIAKGAGLSTGIAYRYFKNKKELLLAALSFSFENIKDIAGVSEEDFITNDISGILNAFEHIHTWITGLMKMNLNICVRKRSGLSES